MAQAKTKGKSKTIEATPDKSTPVETKALAVKYRPRKLDDLVGQDHIVTQIRGMVKTKKFPSTFLITGNTGTGKTTTARMLARIINCESLSACGKCASCRLKKHPDLLEINVGNTRGIDGIRGVIGVANAMPKYNKRIIFLDEVHCLTQQAASALLVPLEEPPPHTVWLLATTDPEKLLNTIRGRGALLDIRPVPEKIMIRRLLEISDNEGVDFRKLKDGKEIMRLLVSFTNGQMRDAINLLEGVLFAVQSGEKLDSKTILANYVNTFDVDLEQTVVKILLAILSGNLKAVLTRVVETKSARAIISKLRWLTHFLLAYSVEQAAFQPYSGRLFLKESRKRDIDLDIPILVRLQEVLILAEIRLNSFSIDEKVVLTSALTNFILDNRKVKR
jgi:DNA polymerase III subunit gamma/tau